MDCNFNDDGFPCAACCMTQLEDIAKDANISLSDSTAVRAKARTAGMADEDISRGLDLDRKITDQARQAITSGMAPEVRKALARWDPKDRHESGRDAQAALVRLESEGYEGASAALAELGRRFDVATGGRRRAEWERMLRGARSLVARTPGRTGRSGFGG